MDTGVILKKASKIRLALDVHASNVMWQCHVTKRMTLSLVRESLARARLPHPLSCKRVWPCETRCWGSIEKGLSSATSHANCSSTHFCIKAGSQYIVPVVSRPEVINFSMGLDASLRKIIIVVYSCVAPH